MCQHQQSRGFRRTDLLDQAHLVADVVLLQQVVIPDRDVRAAHLGQGDDRGRADGAGADDGDGKGELLRRQDVQLPEKSRAVLRHGVAP